ncbi:MAG: helix-turn-helix domain-containing protein [Lachnospiraceae bacterium]|nr:helix-turn-helix domain-containing protein [Lachnospiraceae bacterium]
MDSQVFGQFVAETRKEKKMTQTDLADKIGVTDKAVSRWERGKGFPDINTLEPLSEALDITVLELMRSKKDEMKTTKNKELTASEMTEIMNHAVEMEKEAQRQDRIATWIAVFIVVAVGIPVKLYSNSSILGSLFVGAIVALAAVGIYLWSRNKRDKESRKVYATFMLIGVGLSIGMLEIIGVNPHYLAWGVLAVFALVLGDYNRM